MKPLSIYGIVFLLLFLPSFDIYAQGEYGQTSTLIISSCPFPDIYLAEGTKFHRKRFAGNVVYAELGGFGKYYTINYERVLQSMETRMLNFRIGAGIYSDTDGDTKASKISIPILLNFSIGRSNLFEIGGGITYRDL